MILGSTRGEDGNEPLVLDRNLPPEVALRLEKVSDNGEDKAKVIVTAIESFLLRIGF